MRSMLAGLAAASVAGVAIAETLPQRAPRPRAKPAELSAEAVPVPQPRPVPPAETPTPEKAPAPTEAPPEPGPDKAPAPETAPPAPQADTGTEPAAEKSPAEGEVVETPEKAPVPETEPERPAGAAQKPGAEVPPADAKPTYEPDPRSAERAAAVLPAAEVACRTRLQTLGVTFENRPGEYDVAGCSLPYPVSVRRLGKDLKLEPAALMNCATAETLALFSREVIQPAAREVYGEEVSSIAQASAYVCRPRNGTQKLSEHAFGNAVDISAFLLSKGTRVEVQLAPDEKAASFLGKVREAACGPFKTVLGPGSNADHATHFHFDLAHRSARTACVK